MRLFPTKTPSILKRLYPKRIWSFSRSTETVFLTFDDGPIPEVTPWVLDTLAEYHAKATFFCIGENIQKHPEVFNRILTEGHAIGNHTQHHVNGWKTTPSTYIKNVEAAEKVISAHSNRKSKIEKSKLLFRPPYGKLTSAQAKQLQQKGYTIVMWDVLTYDFDTTLSPEKCFTQTKEAIRPGSIVIFHDSIKAEKNLRYVLPKVLNFIYSKGWKTEGLFDT